MERFLKVMGAHLAYAFLLALKNSLDTTTFGPIFPLAHCYTFLKFYVFRGKINKRGMRRILIMPRDKVEGGSTSQYLSRLFLNSVSDNLRVKS